MNLVFVGIHIKNKPKEFIPLQNVDFRKTVLFLKEEVGKKLSCEASELEITYNGVALEDSLMLENTIRPNAVVHCFKKTKKYVPYEPSPGINGEASIARVQELFNMISHIQINVNSRVNILQKILSEYPEFRRNLGAQALIRDSVLFNTLHQPDIIKNIAEHYPIICEAAPFIVDTVKKELTRTSTSAFSEPATDSTNSSEEENSIGPSTSAEASRIQSENARIRMISRQQLQAALAQIGVGSVNSLSNIAQRNTEEEAGPSSLSTSASGDRISSELFRSGLQRALNSLTQNPEPETEPVQHMDTSEASTPTPTPAPTPAPGATASGFSQPEPTPSTSGDIPSYYRTHQYAEQLRTMAQMGFLNYEENLTYLSITNGNIENAVNLLMGSMN